MVEFDHLIDCPKIEENEKLEDHIIKNSKLITQIWADPDVKNLPVGTFVQFERRCFARIDRKYMDSESNLCIDFIFIPDGKSKGMSNIKNKIDAAKFSKGGEIKEKEAPLQPKKPKGEKIIDESVKEQKMKEKAEKQAREVTDKEDALKGESKDNEPETA
jgi:tRNA synthetases class I (E and Q), anti-codon binding domain